MFGRKNKSKETQKTAEVKQPSSVASYISNLADFGETNPQPESQHVTMVREDGKTANVHKSMVDEYRKGGYELVQ